MDLQHWLAFSAAAAIILAIPGPTILMVLSYAIGDARRSPWPIVAGVTLGDFTAMTLSLAGLGALLAASATLFTVLKLAGAAYLVWLGIKLWRSAPARDAVVSTDPPADSGRAPFLHAYAVTVLNPKSIAFFVAFLPQFLVADAPVLPQFMVMEATFVTLACANAALYAVAARRLRAQLARPAAHRLFARLGGGLLIGTGALTATLQRT